LYFPAVFFGVCAVILLSLCAINLSLGPSCRCHLLTSAGWHALSAPRRLAPANRARVQIVSIIETTQGAAPAGAPPPL
jgi:hypothetical protein